MTDETTPQDSAAMSPASTGSVDKPVAWATLFCGSPLVVSRFKQICDDEAHYQGDVATVIPLYRYSHATVRLPREPEDFEISEANGYAAAIEDFKRALTEAGVEWVD